MQVTADADYITFLLILIVVGGTVGWLISQAMGSGIGSIGDVVIGILGAFLAAWALPRVGVHMPSGFVGVILTALVGSIVVMLIFRIVGQR